MLCFGLLLALLAVASSAPAGVHVVPPATTLTHVNPSQVLVKVDDDHLDSLEDLHEDLHEAHRDAIEDHREAVEDHLEHIEDVFEDHYGVDLGDLFDVDDDDYYHLRAGYVVRPAVQTIHQVPGPTVVRKYYSVPVPLHPVVRVPVPSVRIAVPVPVGPKSIGVGGYAAGPVAVGPKSIGVRPVQPLGVGFAAEPTLSPEVVRKIAEEEVAEAIDDIAKNPGTDVHKKAVEVIKEVQEETAEAKKELLEDAVEAKKDLIEDAVEAQKDLIEDAVEAQKDLAEDAAEAQKDLLEGDKDDDNDRLPRTA